MKYSMAPGALWTQAGCWFCEALGPVGSLSTQHCVTPRWNGLLFQHGLGWSLGPVREQRISLIAIPDSVQGWPHRNGLRIFVVMGALGSRGS